MVRLSKSRMSVRLHSLICAFIFLLVFLSGAIVGVADIKASDRRNQENLSQRDRSLRQAAERRFLKDRTSIVIRYVGDYKVQPNEPIEGDLVVTAGNATVAGEVQGTVLVVRGNVILDSTSHVSGDVICVEGQIERQPGSTIDGDMVETSAGALQNGHREWNDQDDDNRRARRWRNDWERWDDNHEEPFVLRYNRVDGLLLGPRLPRDYGYGRFLNFGIYGFGGYGFASKEWQYQIGGEFYFRFFGRTTLGLEAHDMTTSEDEWIIPEDENSVAAFLIREDFRDYYQRRGFSAYASQKIGSLKLTGAYRDADLLSLKKETNWSLFGGGKRFRNNPAIDEGRLVSTIAGLQFDTRNHSRRPHQGWLIDVQSEFSRPGDHSDFDFDRLIVDIRRYQPLNWGQNLDFRLRIGSSRGTLPAHYLFDLGGISTLRGFDLKSFTGNRMILANFEYRLDAGRSSAHDIWFLEPFNLIFFVDSGLAWFADDLSAIDKSFDSLTWNKLKTDVGIALTDSDGRVRLNFARRTDVGGQGLAITLRLNRDF